MDNPIYHKNYEVLKHRYPFIVAYLESLNEQIDVDLIENTPQKTLVYKGHHLSSCYDRAYEAQIQNSSIPPSAEIAYLYGVGLGDGINHLLETTQLKTLHVHILSPIIFYLYLNFFDARTWLNDERITLHLAHDKGLQHPYAVNAAELFWAEEKANELKNLIQIDRNQTHQTLFHTSDMLELYRHNVTRNQQFVKQDPYIETLEEVHQRDSKPFVLIAGGPTASEQFSWLKEKQKDYILIAASTALIALEQVGIVPDYVAVLDPKPLLAKHLMVKQPTQYKNTILAYYPTASYEAVSVWPGKRIICLTDLNALLKESSQAHPKSILYLGGSVAHTTVALAKLLGAKEVILVGFDFCFAYGKSHLEHNPLAYAVGGDKNAETTVLNGHQKIIPSQINFISYKQALEEFIAANPQIKFYNTGKEGAVIKGAPWI